MRHPYLYVEFLNEIQAVGIDWIALVVAIGGVVGIWVKLEIAMKAIQVRQGAMEANLELLRTMVERQIEVDNSIKDRLTNLMVGQENLHGKFDTLSERIKK